MQFLCWNNEKWDIFTKIIQLSTKIFENMNEIVSTWQKYKKYEWNCFNFKHRRVKSDQKCMKWAILIPIIENCTPICLVFDEFFWKMNTFLLKSAKVDKHWAIFELIRWNHVHFNRNIAKSRPNVTKF